MFNSPLEAGLRALFVLSAAGRRGFDTQRLVYFDYLLIHSGEVDGPESLHPETPLQGGEVLVRRRLLQEGIELLLSRELAERRYQRTGIVYRATAAGRHVADLFDSEYAGLLRERARWVVDAYGGHNDRELTKMLRPRLATGEDELIPDLWPAGGELDGTD